VAGVRRTHLPMHTDTDTRVSARETWAVECAEEESRKFATAMYVPRAH
jgi:hypothetical protein